MTPPNNSMQRTALRAAADAERYMRFFDYSNFLVCQNVELIDKLVDSLIGGFYLALKQ